jgi:MarR family transcriptional regulator, negative regulator of the multidrug operon emrRAB
MAFSIGKTESFGDPVVIYVRCAHIVKLKSVRRAHIAICMIDRSANLLGALGLAVADRIASTAHDILQHSGETPAALVVIGYGLGPSNEQLRRILGLSHPGTVRLTDRLVADGLVERRQAKDRRAVALYLTETGAATREQLLRGRLAAIRPLLAPLSDVEQGHFAALLHKILGSMETTDAQRCALCRLCDNRVCTNCPIPASFRNEPEQAIALKPPRAAATPP